MERTVGEYTISTEPNRLDLPLVHRFLAEDSYWAAGIPLEVMTRAVRGSLCFGAYYREAQVGFARVVTDYATFGHIMDVFVLPEHRGHGLGKELMACIMTHPRLQGFRRWQLGTRDAHGLYARFGFHVPPNPEIHMEKTDPDVYVRAAASERVV
jgi:GNAT superfamily N-acetyltransferase